MTSKSDLQLILAAMQPMANGDPAPSFRNHDFAELVGAACCIAAQDNRAALESIGRRALYLLLGRLGASMQTERAMAMMRDNGKPLC